MATATIQISISATINGQQVRQSKNFEVTLTGEDYDQGTISIATSDTQPSFKSSLATIGWVLLYNSDTTNYIQYGKYNSGSPVYTDRVPPNSAVMWFCDLAANDISFKANTAACKLHFLAFER